MKKSYIIDTKGTMFMGENLACNFAELLLARRDASTGILKEDVEVGEFGGAWKCYTMLIGRLNDAVARCYRAFELRKETAHYSGLDMSEQYYLDNESLKVAFANALNDLLDMYGLKLDESLFTPATFYPKAGDFRKDKDTQMYYLKSVGDTAFRKFTERLFADFIESRTAMSPEQFKEYRKAQAKAKRAAEKARKLAEATSTPVAE